MVEFVSLKDAISEFVNDGDYLCMEGFTHLIPFAAGFEVIRQQKRDLSLVRMTPDLIYDMLIGSGCVNKLKFSWGGNPGVGSLHRFRDAVENQWPHPVLIEEHSHADMANSYVAGAANLPFSIVRGYSGTDLPKYNSNIQYIECPFSKEELAATPSIRPDATVIHAQKADKKGNVSLWGILGVQKEAVLAARRVIITVEEIVDELDACINSCVLPNWAIDCICLVSGGAFPSYAQGYYERDNQFYLDWDQVSRDRGEFLAWIKKYILETKDFDSFRKLYFNKEYRLKNKTELAVN